MVLLLALFTTLSNADELPGVLNKELICQNTTTVKFSYEKGFLGVLNHTIQFGVDGTNFDYVKEGGQDILFPYERYTAEINFNNKHSIILLAQPFDLLTRETMEKEVMIDSVVFPMGTVVDFKYGFSFYRISYLYDFCKCDRELALGLSFQIRNADITFSSKDNSLFVRNSNIGPVPILKFRGKLPFKNKYWLGGEVDGFYASGKYITGSKNDFQGAILDASAQTGIKLSGSWESFLNVRYIGGGAEGDENNPDRPGEGYTNNWIKTLAVSVGLNYKL